MITKAEVRAKYYVQCHPVLGHELIMTPGLYYRRPIWLPAIHEAAQDNLVVMLDEGITSEYPELKDYYIIVVSEWHKSQDDLCVEEITFEMYTRYSWEMNYLLREGAN